MIFLQILKIIGIILLVLLGLVFILLLLVLFDPIFYRLKGSVDNNKPSIDLKLHWIFHIIAVSGYYRDKEAQLFYRIFFKKSYVYGGPDELEEIKDIDEEENIDIEDNVDKNLGKDEISEEAWDNIGDLADEDVDLEEDEAKKEEALEDEAEEINNSVESEKLTDKPKNKVKFADKIRDKIKQIKKKYRQIRRNFRKYKRIVTDEYNHQAVAFLKVQLFKLIKAILPKKFILNGIYSLGAPDKTAYAFGVLSLFPFTHNKTFRLGTDFESDKMYFEGNFDIKGRIYLITIIFIALKVFFNRKCRRMYRMFKK